ncbi:MAG: hypothetical protein QN178_12720 [Armatimonadota bacterium]|nr:hypothetical protein [Armatimonadota bacterium]
MPKRRIAAVLASALLIVLCAPARAVLAFDTWWHAEATRHGVIANGFSADARLATQVTNYLTDFHTVAADKIGGFEGLYRRLPGGPPQSAPTAARLDPVDMDRLHFDSLRSTAEVEAQWATLEANTKAALRKYATDPSVKPGFRPIVLLTILGASLHMVQDFYSHSNWVNEFVKKSPGSPVPTWQDVPAAQRAAMPLHTGAYPDGCCPGQPDHEALTKDSSDRALNAEAVDVAKRGSIAWVRLLMQDQGIPWATLTGHKVAPTVGRRFLYDLDATFLTSSSILAGHFDGPRPAKFVFASDGDLGRERRMARQALLLVLGGYSTNLGVIDNPYKLPTPYWAGFLVYHIERDLAKGLLLSGRRR